MLDLTMIMIHILPMGSQILDGILILRMQNILGMQNRKVCMLDLTMIMIHILPMGSQILDGILILGMQKILGMHLWYNLQVHRIGTETLLRKWYNLQVHRIGTETLL